MSISWYSKRYRTPDVEIQRINNILQKQALERAQQEIPTSSVQLIGVEEESFLGLYDKFKAKLWTVSDLTNFAIKLEPDKNTLICGADFNAGVVVDDSAFMGNIIKIVGTPAKEYGLEDGDNMHVPLDLQFNGTSDYVRIPDNANIRLKEIMESPPSGVDGITLIFRISPVWLGPDDDQYLLSKFDNNSLTYGMQIKLKPNGDIHWFVRRNNVDYKVYANNPFTLIPPPPGNYYLTNFMPENYMTVAANGVVSADHILFFQFKFSDNSMKILKGAANDITAGTSTDTISTPFALPEPPVITPPTAEEIPITGSTASGADTDHPKEYAYDNNTGTYWLHSSRSAYLLADLGVAQRITSVQLQWPDGATKRYYYDVYTGNSTDTSKMTRVTSNTLLSALGTGLQTYTFPSEKYARYVLIAGYGNQGDPTPSPPVSEWLNLVSMGAEATAEGSESPNVPANVKDGSLSTRWAYKKRGTWVKIDLKVVKLITRLGIAWYKSEYRKYRFNVQVSTDNTNWTQVYPFDGRETDQSDIRNIARGDDEYDHVPLENPKSARYIRVNIWGNTTNEWANIWEIRVRGMSAGGTGEPQSAFGLTELNVMGFPAETEIDPFVTLYNVASDAPNTDEFFTRLHAPVVITETQEETQTEMDWNTVYNVTTNNVGRDLGAGFDRWSRGQIVSGSSNCPFYNKKLGRVSCYVKRHGNPTGNLLCYIYRESGGNYIVKMGSGKDVSTISKNSFQEITFTNVGNTHKMGEGDIVSFDYYGGDDENYLELGAQNSDTIPDTYHVFYSDDWHDNDQQELCGKYEEVVYSNSTSTTTTTTVTIGNLIAAQQIHDNTSSLYGQVLSKFTFYLRKKGTPTGTVYFKLLDAQNNEIYTLGSVATTSITSVIDELTAITVDYASLANTPALVDYKIAVEYTGGNPSNYIMVKLNDDGNASSSLTVKNSNGAWTHDLDKDLAAIIQKGGKTRVISGSPIPPTPAPVENYSHDMFMFVAGEENTRLRLFTWKLKGFYNGKANRFRFYRRILTNDQMTNFNTNKKSISAIAYGKIFSPLTFIQPV